MDSLLNQIEIVVDSNEKAVLYNSVAIYLSNRDTERAFRYAEKAAKLGASIGYYGAWATGLRQMGVCSYYLGNLDEAITYYNESSELFREIEELDHYISNLLNLALVFAGQGAYQMAIDTLLKANQIYDKLPERTDAIYYIHSNIGSVYSDMEETEQAKIHTLKAIGYALEFGDSIGWAGTHLNLGRIYHLQEGNYPEAIKAYEIARKYLKRFNHTRGLKIALGNLGSVSIALEEYEKASEYLHEVINMANGNPDLISSTTYYNLGSIKLKQKKYPEAIEWMRKADERETGFSDMSKKIHDALAQLYAKVGNYELAYSHLIDYHEVMDSLFSDKNLKSIGKLEGELALQKERAAKEEREKELLQEKLQQTQISAGLFVGILLIGLFSFLIWYRGQKKRAFAQAENLRLTELDKAKSRLFTNISHEFRTPLTLIKSPLEDLIISERGGKEEATYINMYQNADRLLQLVNQMLDLAKLESGYLKLRPEPGDMIGFIKLIAANFKSLAEQKNITYQIISSEESFFTFFDHDKLEKVVVNLLSNALKFSPVGGHVKLETGLKEGMLFIQVFNNGSVIPQEEQANIFDRFYQPDYSQAQGSGIGLALVKELVELQHGQISVESKEETGTVFRVELPVEQVDTDLTDLPEIQLNGNYFFRQFLDRNLPEQESLGSNPAEKELPKLLIVEDHDEVRAYIRQQLDSQFQIVEAKDGEEGLNHALEIMPDLIISDVMMPNMDGVSLCQELKSNILTDHIPVILLTAKVDIESRMEGLQTGADDYLAKPFHNQELMIRSLNLVDQRRKLQKRFSQTIWVASEGLKIDSAEDKFIKKVIGILEVSYSNPEFSVNDFADHMGMSRVQLHRKLKAITGLSATDFIRSFRLEKAEKLIVNQADSISQIAYQVGFNNLSYFAKCFKEKYGNAPSEYKKG